MPIVDFKISCTHRGSKSFKWTIKLTRRRKLQTKNRTKDNKGTIYLYKSNKSLTFTWERSRTPITNNARMSRSCYNFVQLYDIQTVAILRRWNTAEESTTIYNTTFVNFFLSKSRKLTFAKVLARSSTSDKDPKPALWKQSHHNKNLVHNYTTNIKQENKAWSPTPEKRETPQFSCVCSVNKRTTLTSLQWFRYFVLNNNLFKLDYKEIWYEVEMKIPWYIQYKIK